MRAYDHRDEVRHYLNQAAEWRASAARIRSEADRQARALEADADRREQLARQVCRLCASPAATCCFPKDSQ